VPFHYYGIFDEEVNYQEIPWRSGKFDPEQLSNKLATLARARHAYKKWHELFPESDPCLLRLHSPCTIYGRTIQQMGVKAEAVYAGSDIVRSEALEQLADGRLQVVFQLIFLMKGWTCRKLIR